MSETDPIVTSWNEIIQGCRRGDPAAQSMAYNRCWKQLYPSVYRILRNREEAEDILQESFIHGFQKIKALSDPEKYPAWQKQISIRSALTRLRQLRPTASLFPETELADEAPEPDHWPSRETVDEHIAALPEGYRLVVTLYLVDGLSHDEIAGSLGIHPSTARSQYSRALAKLRQSLFTHEQA